MRRAAVIAMIAAALGIAAWAGAGGPAGAQKIGFDLKEKQIIVDFYGGGDGGGGGNPGKGKGKGKQNKGKGVGNQGMPPGLAMNGRLPPGIAKRQLPPALVAQLPPPPKGFERVIVDNDILLVEIVTQVIHDVVTDVWH